MKEAEMQVSSNNKHKFLTEKETAHILGMSQRTLANWRKSKKGPPWVCIEDHSIRYSEAELLDWLNSQSKN